MEELLLNPLVHLAAGLYILYIIPKTHWKYKAESLHTIKKSKGKISLLLFLLIKTTPINHYKVKELTVQMLATQLRILSKQDTNENVRWDQSFLLTKGNKRAHFAAFDPRKLSTTALHWNLSKVLEQDIVVCLPPGARDVRKANRKEAPLTATPGPSLFTELAVAWGPGISGTQGGFSDPLPRFQMLVNLPALFLSALSSPPGLSAFTRLLMSIHRGRGEGASAGRQLQLEASLLGIGLAVRLWPLRLSFRLPFSG